MKIKYEYIKKIEKIFSYYEKNGSKLWNIGTSLYSTWERFILFLKRYNQNLKFKFIVCKKTSKNIDKEKGLLLLNGLADYNVTPATSNSRENGWAKSSINQFLQEAIAFDALNCDVNWSKTWSNKMNSTRLLEGLLEYENFDSIFIVLLRHALINSLSSARQSTKNLGFTIFFVLIFKYFDINFLKEFHTPIKFESAASQTNESKSIESTDYERIIWNCRNLYSITYSNSVDLLANFKIDNIYETIDMLYQMIR